ncbi:MAG TPA: hypothetical protein DDZ51_22040 [Planctomycetaceae bacterium]|nr:hypothetical protein [Planctomycetaceae bacterium]
MFAGDVDGDNVTGSECIARIEGFREYRTITTIAKQPRQVPVTYATSSLDAGLRPNQPQFKNLFSPKGDTKTAGAVLHRTA